MPGTCGGRPGRVACDQSLDARGESRGNDVGQMLSLPLREQLFPAEAGVGADHPQPDVGGQVAEQVAREGHGVVGTGAVVPPQPELRDQLGLLWDRQQRVQAGRGCSQSARPPACRPRGATASSPGPASSPRAGWATCASPTVTAAGSTAGSRRRCRSLGGSARASTGWPAGARRAAPAPPDHVAGAPSV